MSWAGEVLIQTRQPVECFVTKVAAITVTVPGCFGRNVGGGRVLMPSNLLVGEDVPRIDLSAILINLLPIDTRLTVAAFQVETDSGKVGKHIGAPWAFDVTTLVD